MGVIYRHESTRTREEIAEALGRFYANPENVGKPITGELVTSFLNEVFESDKLPATTNQHTDQKPVLARARQGGTSGNLT